MLVDVTSVSAVDFVSYLILNVFAITAMSFALVFGSLCGYQGYVRLVRYLYPETQSNLVDYAIRLLNTITDTDEDTNPKHKEQQSNKEENNDQTDNNESCKDTTNNQDTRVDDDIAKINIDIENMVDKLTNLFGASAPIAKKRLVEE